MRYVRSATSAVLACCLCAVVAHAGPPSKTAVTTKLACSNAVGSANATVELCEIAQGALCFGATYQCPYTLECGSESTSGVRSDTRACDAGFAPQSFSYAITVVTPNPGGCFGSTSSFGSVNCGTASPKLTVR